MNHPSFFVYNFVANEKPAMGEWSPPVYGSGKNLMGFVHAKRP
jgi:hypothetical protein